MEKPESILKDVLESLKDLSINVSNNNIITAGLKERADSHSVEYSRSFEKLWDEVRGLRKEVGGAITSLEKDVSNLKAERSLMIKVVTPIVSIITATVTSLIAGHVKP